MLRAIMALLAAAMLLPVLMLGCNAENGENAMSKAEIPAIDANPPAVTATATFALG